MRPISLKVISSLFLLTNLPDRLSAGKLARENPWISRSLRFTDFKLTGVP